MKSNILFVVPNPDDATSWYRAYGPFGALRKENPDISLITGPGKYTWSLFNLTDITFMQRPFSAGHLKIAKMAKDAKNFLWLDYDDDLFSVPQDNPAFRSYSNEGTRKNISTMIAMADVVTVSTEFLKKKMEPLNKNIIVVNNALNDYVLKSFDPEPFKDRSKFFNWRGSNTHHRDIMRHAEGMINAKEMSLKKDWKWHWIGYHPWYVTERFADGQCLVSDPLDVMEFNKFMAKLQPTCQIVPLAKNDFNKSKSNIAWIEATYSGAVTIAPDWEEWNKPGVLTYSGPKQFEARLQHVMGLPNEELERLLKLSQEEVKKNYLLSVVNKKRMAIIEDMMSSRNA